MAQRIINNKLMDNIIDQFDLNGYDIEQTQDAYDKPQSYIVTLDGNEVFRALSNSKRTNWLALYDDAVLKPRKAY